MPSSNCKHSLPSGRFAHYLVGDLNDDAYLKQVEEPWPAEVDVFVNNAGVLRYAPLLELSSEDCEWMFQTNVLASLKVTQILGRAMVARKAGHMVFMTSIAAREVYRLASVYCATKHALSALGALIPPWNCKDLASR